MRLLTVTFIDIKGNIIMTEKVTSLPLREECIINRSIELFSDPEPCIIHRTYVMKRVFLEICSYFDKMYEEHKQELLVNNLPVNIIQSIDIKGQLSKIILIGQ